MDCRTLLHTWLSVSRFGFGTMTLGKPLDQAGTNQVIDRCLDAGINFFDTANMYNGGVAETIARRRPQGPPRQSRPRQQSVLQDGRRARRAGPFARRHPASHRPACAPAEPTTSTSTTCTRPTTPCPSKRRWRRWTSWCERARCAIPRARITPLGRWCRCLDLPRSAVCSAPYISQPMYNLLARGIEQEYLAMCQAVRRLHGGLQPAGRRTAHRQAAARSAHCRHSLRQQSDVPGPLLARAIFQRGRASARRSPISGKLAGQPVAQLAAASHHVRR